MLTGLGRINHGPTYSEVDVVTTIPEQSMKEGSMRIKKIILNT